MTLVKFTQPNQDVFESIFNDTFFNDRMISRVPAVNISETENHYHVELAAPGLKKEDFKLNLERNSLSVSVERGFAQQHDQKHYSKREFGYSSFIRTFTLPDCADHNQIEATYTDGILNIAIAKREEAKLVRRQIEIK